MQKFLKIKMILSFQTKLNQSCKLINKNIKIKYLQRINLIRIKLINIKNYKFLFKKLKIKYKSKNNNFKIYNLQLKIIIIYLNNIMKKIKY